MSESTESPAQRQARIRREKREAKIKAGGNERLDKITKMSGRAAELMQNDAPSRGSSSSSPVPPAPTPPIMTDSEDASQIRAQEEFLRSMIRAQHSPGGQGPNNQPQAQTPEDPIMKLLSSFAGAEGSTDAKNPSGSPISPEKIHQATGMPTWAANLLNGGQGPIPPAGSKAKAAINWGLVHTLFSVVAGIYLLFVLEGATAEFGQDPPPPATVKDPFLIFVLGELLLLGSRTLFNDVSYMSSVSGWYRMLKDVGRDGSVVLFMLGAANWWKGTAR